MKRAIHNLLVICTMLVLMAILAIASGCTDRQATADTPNIVPEDIIVENAPADGPEAVNASEATTNTATAVPDMTPESIAENGPADVPDAANTVATVPSDARHAPLPRFVDLGATGCIPCKMMEPVLIELERDYGDRLQVEFIDITQDSAAAQTYQIRSIPTQIYFSADGLELARHEGFIPKEDVLAKFAELGIDLGTGGVTSGTGGAN